MQRHITFGGAADFQLLTLVRRTCHTQKSGADSNGPLRFTAQDMPHILEKFVAEFETYWNSQEFIPFDPDEPSTLREAIKHARTSSTMAPVFFDIAPHPFQERI